MIRIVAVGGGGGPILVRMRFEQRGVASGWWCNDEPARLPDVSREVIAWLGRLAEKHPRLDVDRMTLRWLEFAADAERGMVGDEAAA